MDADEFTERLARVRQRFAAALPTKIGDGFAVLSTLTRSSTEAIGSLVDTHRKLHEMCGIAPTIGFAATGTAARAAETLLREPAKSKRPLTLEEAAAFSAALEGLREAAQADLKSNTGRG